MRKLMWFTVGFGISCVLFAWLLPTFLLFYAAIGAAALAGLSALLTVKWKSLRIIAVSAFGCAAGLLWCMLFFGQYLAYPSSLDGTEQFLAATVTDHSYETGYGLGVDAVTILDGKPYQIRMYLEDTDPLQPGDKVEGLFQSRLTTPQSQKGATYHQGKGIYVMAYQRQDVVISRTESVPTWAFASSLRKAIQTILETSFSNDTAAFAKGLLLGDTTDLTYEMDTAFQISGIRHIVAVSGLHISILFALISNVTFRRRFLTALLGFPSLMIFAAVAGFTPSVCRACIMCGLMLLAQLIDKDYDSPTALAFSALVMMIGNPLVITSVSFQLSIASVAGIFLFREGIQNWILERFPKAQPHTPLQNLIRWFASSVAISLSAMTLTTPLCAWYFGTVSLVGVLTNLLTLWVISFLFYGLMGVCILHYLWPAAGLILARIVALPMHYVLWVSKALSSLPLAAVYTQSVYIVIWLAWMYTLLVIFLFQKNRRPGILGCCAAVGLCLAMILSWTEPLLSEARVTVLDVGQGQSILLQSEGRTFLVDCGGDTDSAAADMAAETLLSQGITHLDGVILTHWDADHAGGLTPLLSRIQTDFLLVPDIQGAKSCPQIDGAVCYVEEDLQISFGDGKITVFGPIYNGDDNENSLCVLFETQNCAILITGDRTDFGERMLMRHTSLPDVDVLIAGHHGAKTSTSVELLQTVTPETVIISVGKGNYYGHPHDDLLSRLEEFGCSVYRTDIHGTIIYRR